MQYKKEDIRTMWGKRRKNNMQCQNNTDNKRRYYWLFIILAHPHAFIDIF